MLPAYAIVYSTFLRTINSKFSLDLEPRYGYGYTFSINIFDWSVMLREINWRSWANQQHFFLFGCLSSSGSRNSAEGKKREI